MGPPAGFATGLRTLVSIGASAGIIVVAVVIHNLIYGAPPTARLTAGIGVLFLLIRLVQKETRRSRCSTLQVGLAYFRSRTDLPDVPGANSPGASGIITTVMEAL